MPILWPLKVEINNLMNGGIHCLFSQTQNIPFICNGLNNFQLYRWKLWEGSSEGVIFKKHRRTMQNKDLFF